MKRNKAGLYIIASRWLTFFFNLTVMDASRKMTVGHLFSSNAAVEVLVQSLQQYTQTRLDMSRDLLLLLIIATQLGEKVSSYSDTFGMEVVGQLDWSPRR